MIVAEPLARASAGPSTPRERTIAILFGAGLISAAILWAVEARHALPYSPQFAAAYVTALAMSSVSVALLLIFRAHMIGDRSAALAAAAFTFCVPLIVGYAITFPGAAAAWLARPEASGWMSFGWRLGWPVGIMWYARHAPAQQGRLARTIAIALAYSAVAIALACSGLLPRLYAPTGPGAYHVTLYLANLLAIVLDSAAIWLLLRKRSITLLDTWFAVSLAVIGFASVLILFTGSRLSAAADAVRLSNVISSFLLACVLLYEFQRLVVRSMSLDRYLTMAQFAPSIVYLLDPDGTCIYVNPRWVSLTGQSAVDALGDGWIAAIHPDDVARSAPQWRAAVAARCEHEIELRYRTADGGYRWHLATATPTFDAEGNLNGWYGAAMDIDEQRRHADELNELYAREHTMAQKLQSAFVPPFLPSVDGLAFRAVYRPALRETELGGDWYDAFLLTDGRIAVSIGDVAGHGIDAAIAMVRLRETLRAATMVRDADPAAILQMADHAFMATHPSLFATAAFGVYDPQTRAFTYARAGHPPPLIRRDGSVTPLPAPPGVPLGVVPNSSFVAEHVTLALGDVLVFYTDGITEVDRNMLEGERRFCSLLERYPDDIERVVDEALAERQRDDVALLELSVTTAREQSSWHFESDDAASAWDARAAFVAHLLRRGVAGEALAAAELVLGELVGNVVRHAPGPIAVELLVRDGRLVLVVRDRGPRFVPGDTALPADPLAESGRGLHIISLLSAPPEVVPRPGGGNEVVVALPAPVEATSPYDSVPA